MSYIQYFAEILSCPMLSVYNQICVIYALQKFRLSDIRGTVFVNFNFLNFDWTKMTHEYSLI